MTPQLLQIRLFGRFGVRRDGTEIPSTPFTDRGFGSVPALAGVTDLLDAILVA